MPISMVRRSTSRICAAVRTFMGASPPAWSCRPAIRRHRRVHCTTASMARAMISGESRSTFFDQQIGKPLLAEHLAVFVLGLDHAVGVSHQHVAARQAGYSFPHSARRGRRPPPCRSLPAARARLCATGSAAGGRRWCRSESGSFSSYKSEIESRVLLGRGIGVEQLVQARHHHGRGERRAGLRHCPAQWECPR